MRVAVIDIGSNTARLLVASAGARGVVPLHEERALLALGDEIERFGRISDLQLFETAERVRGCAQRARALGCTSLSVIVTAPGRQSANAGALVSVLERATGLPIRVLSSDEEGRLAYDGAVGQADDLPRTVAVCDVGGGSTEIVVGEPSVGPALCCSFDIGSLRLTRRLLDDDPPGRKAIARARREVAWRLDALGTPSAEKALVTGGAARSLRRLNGGRLIGADELRHAVETVRRRTSAGIAREFGLDPVRARTILAGSLILAEVQSRLGITLEVARGGLREGAALALLAEATAAA
jgi:exopolyphosphatase / guanosine-5'-triphosphate,3'-diphosphate pyrophosphatase